MTPHTVSLKQFIPDHKCRNHNRGKRSDPCDDDYDCDTAHDYDFRFTMNFNAPYDCDCDYDASVNQALYTTAL